MSVSRQTISRWEADEIIPELSKIIALSDVFSCKLDTLVKEDMIAFDKIYSEITIKKVKAFKMARYVMVTPKPEDDVNVYMDNWAQQSGLLTIQPDAMRIGWDFPYVSSELQNRFGLRGYVAAYILPEGFETSCLGVEFANQQEADYAVITIYDPFAAAFERIPNAYKIYWIFYRQMDFVRSRKMTYYLVLSMCIKKRELLVWMYISMWIVFQKQIASQIFQLNMRSKQILLPNRWKDLLIMMINITIGESRLESLKNYGIQVC